MEYSSFLLGIIIAIYLAIDAPKHHKRPWLWAILGFIFGPIALGIYLIQTDRKVLGWIITILSILIYIIFFIIVILGVLFVSLL
jgi:disulfide bond formation protein DsbB